MIRVFTVFAIVLMMTSAGRSGDGLAIMKVEHGARPAGMGAAFVAVTDDPNGTAYNPASIVSLSNFTASFGHTAYWENVRLESGYFAVNLSSRTFLHGGVRFAVVDELEQRQTPSEEPETIFDSHDISMKAGLSYRMMPWLTAGFSMGWFMEKINSYSGSAFNVDFGLLIKARNNLDVGAAVTGIGSNFTLSQADVVESREISLPTTYRLGAAYSYQKYLGAMDIVIVDDEAHLHLGAEGRLHENFKLRAGYMANYDSKNVSAGASFTQRNITVDYAFVPYTNDLGTSHMFNFTFGL